jgi:hypothetical protein
MKKLVFTLTLFMALATSPAFAFGHGGHGGGGFHGGGHFGGRSVGHFGGRGLGWAVPALGAGVIGGYGVSECYQWNGWQWVYVCGYPNW